MNKKYFTYLLKNYRVAILFFAVLFFGISATPFIAVEGSSSAYNAALGIMNVFTIGMVFVLPVILFSFVHRRRSADLFLALPVSREEQLITNLLFAFLCVFGIFFVTSLVLWIPAASSVAFTTVLAVNANAALVIASLLLIHSAWYLIANNVFDGIVMIASWSFLPLLIYAVLATFAETMVAGQSVTNMINPSMWLSPLAMGVRNLITFSEGNGRTVSVLYNILIAVWGAVGAAGTYFHFVKRKSERAEQLSDDPLAYPLIINFYALSILIMMAFSFVQDRSFDLLTIYLLLLFVYVVAQFVYRRKIRITPRILITFGALSLISMIFAVTAFKTRGFGQAERYTVDGDSHIRITYHAAVDQNDLEKAYRYHDGYSDEEMLDLYVTAMLPVKDYLELPALRDLFEAHRQDGIDFFYSENRNQPENLSLSFQNCNSSGSAYCNSYYYKLAKPFTLDELKKLEQIPFTEINIYDPYEGESYSLTQWLARKGN